MVRKFFSMAQCSGLVLPGSLLLLALVIPLLQKQIERSSPSHGELRDLKVEHLRLARALDVLTENAELVSVIDQERLTENELTLSLIESIKHFVQQHQLELVSLSVVASEVSVLAGANPTLRVSIAANVSASTDLLSLFDVVRSAANWRPIEVRACTVALRDGSELHRLHANCAIDVYRFIGKA